MSHDCVVGDHAIFANNASLGGHARIGHHVMMGGFATVQQWCRVGDHAMIASQTAVDSDVIPFGIAVVRMTSELKVRTTTVSIKGSNRATRPSEAGLSV